MAIASFQKQVQKTPAKGVPGDKASRNPVVYTEQNYVAGDENVTVGNFVWDAEDIEAAEAAETADETAFDWSEYAPSVAVAVSTVTTTKEEGNGGNDGPAPLGIVERNLSYANYNLLDGGTLTLPKGAPLNIIRRGDVYVVAEDEAERGDPVYAKREDGSIWIGTTESESDYIATNWTVTKGGAAGELITISNWSA